MRNKITYLITLLFILSMNSIFAQNVPIDFETGGNGANWTWNVFENDTNPALEIISNPDATGINTSATVAKFTALQTGNPWAGTESMHGSDLGTFTLDASNATVKIMVWKPVISDVGIKFVLPSGEALPEIKVANTVTNQWEELTFDFSSRIGHTSTIGQDQIVIFPDFDLGGRTQDNICYFDNITFSEAGSGSDQPTVAAPTPTIDPSNVISIYSDAYTNVAGTDINPNWNQTTVTSEVLIEGNNTLKYAGLDYQGTQFGSVQDVTNMTYLHVDYWTADATALQLYLISVGSGEQPYDFTITTDTWNSVDIPLSTYSNLGLTLNDIHQFKFVGNGTVFLDNLYFTSTLTSVEEITDVVPKAYTLKQNYPNPFNPTTKISFSVPEANNVKLVVYNLLGQKVATLVNQFVNAGSYNVNFDATDLPSGTYVYSITAGNFSSVKKMMLLK